MDNTNTSQENSQLAPNEAAASLAFATQLHEKMMGAQAPQMPQNAPGQAEISPMPQDTHSQEMTPKMKKMHEDMKPEMVKMESKMTEMELSLTKKLDEIRQAINDRTSN